MEQKEMKTARLKRLETKLLFIEKSKAYLEKELVKIRVKEKIIKEKISKEKKAIALVIKAKKLR